MTFGTLASTTFHDAYLASWSSARNDGWTGAADRMVLSGTKKLIENFMEILPGLVGTPGRCKAIQRKDRRSLIDDLAAVSEHL